MKYFILSLLFSGLLVVGSSCNKDREKLAISNSLQGSWEISEAQASMLPLTTYPAGNGNRLTFSGSAYQQISNNSIVKSGTYTIEDDGSVEETVGLSLPAGKFTKRIIYDGDRAAGKIFFDIDNNELTFVQGYFPLDSGSKTTYRRVANAEAP